MNWNQIELKWAEMVVRVQPGMPERAKTTTVAPMPAPVRTARPKPKPEPIEGTAA